MFRETWYRALCFGKPIAPWRNSRDAARRDLIDAHLGSYDDYGAFYITVPGEMAKASKWVKHEAAA
jgi:hypothetical protein